SLRPPAASRCSRAARVRAPSRGDPPLPAAPPRSSRVFTILRWGGTLKWPSLGSQRRGALVTQPQEAIVVLVLGAVVVLLMVGLRTLALSAVSLVALSAGGRPLEAAFKYFVLGAISLAGLLYGLGLIYLGTGSFGFPSAAQIGSSPIVLGGVVLVGMGFAFELALFPFHWGALDAYTAAAPSLAGFVMSASKLAAAFALGRLVLAAGVELGQILVWVGSLTIVWGTFGALAQAA